MDRIPRNVCPKHLTRLNEKIKRFANGAFHIEGRCAECGDKYIKYVPYVESEIVHFLIAKAWEEENGIC